MTELSIVPLFFQRGDEVDRFAEKPMKIVDMFIRYVKKYHGGCPMPVPHVELLYDRVNVSDMKFMSDHKYENFHVSTYQRYKPSSLRRSIPDEILANKFDDDGYVRKEIVNAYLIPSLFPHSSFFCVVREFLYGYGKNISDILLEDLPK
jgi:hypothetical protein